MKIADLVIAEISKEENKNKIVEALNKNINIPIINEKTEEKYISAMVETFISVLKKVL